eukprot:5205843-Alexandrium_andersonii.AAC.1
MPCRMCCASSPATGRSSTGPPTVRRSRPSTRTARRAWRPWTVPTRPSGRCTRPRRAWTSALPMSTQLA